MASLLLGPRPGEDPLTPTQRAWMWLLAAGLLEVAWAIGLKYSDGFRRPVVTTVTVIAMLASFWGLAQALRTLPVGTGYAVWTGIGAVGTSLLGIALLGEPRDPRRLACIALIVAGIAGLKLLAPADPGAPSAPVEAVEAESAE